MRASFLLPLAIAIGLPACRRTSCSSPLPERSVTFAGRKYVQSASPDRVCLVPVDSGRSVCLRRGQLVRWDFTGDGLPDLGLVLDERDGFRNTFAYLTIYPNGATPIESVTPLDAKWKERHWAWIDVREMPGLDPSTKPGACFAQYMRGLDARHR